MKRDRDSLLIWAFVLSVGIISIIVTVVVLSDIEVDLICLALPATLIEGAFLLYILSEYSKMKEKGV